VDRRRNGTQALYRAVPRGSRTQGVPSRRSGTRGRGAQARKRNERRSARMETTTETTRVRREVAIAARPETVWSSSSIPTRRRGGWHRRFARADARRPVSRRGPARNGGARRVRRARPAAGAVWTWGWEPGSPSPLPSAPARWRSISCRPTRGRCRLTHSFRATPPAGTPRGGTLPLASCRCSVGADPGSRSVAVAMMRVRAGKPWSCSTSSPRCRKGACSTTRASAAGTGSSSRSSGGGDVVGQAASAPGLRELIASGDGTVNGPRSAVPPAPRVGVPPARRCRRLPGLHARGLELRRPRRAAS
jgi:hypothetical protein